MDRRAGLQLRAPARDYRIWTETDNPYRLKEAELRGIDRAVQFGDKYGIHGMLNFHRAPGYTVAPRTPHSEFSTSSAVGADAHA